MVNFSFHYGEQVTEKNKSIYSIKTQLGFTKVLQDRAVQKRNFVVCSVPFCKCCSRETERILNLETISYDITRRNETENETEKLPIIIPDFKFLVTFTDLIKDHMAKKYHIVILQTFLEKAKETYEIAYKRLIRMKTNPFLNVSIYCDRFLKFGFDTSTRMIPFSKRTKSGLKSLVSHFISQNMPYYVIGVFKPTKNENNLIKKDSIIRSNENDDSKSLSNTGNSKNKTGFNFITIEEFSENFDKEIKPYLEMAKQNPAIRRDSLPLEEDNFFEEHLSFLEFSKLPSSSRFVGRFNRRSNSEIAEVKSFEKKSLNESVFIVGFKNMNRALNEDLVGVMILNQNEMVSKGLKSLTESENNDNNNNNNNNNKNGKKSKNKHKLKKKEMFGSSDRKKMLGKRIGKVVTIVERNNGFIFGSISATEKTAGSALFLPSDKKLPPITIMSKDLNKLKNKKISVSVDSWPPNSEFPIGHFREIIGESDTIEAETKCLLKENNFESHGGFPSALLESLRKGIPLLKEESVKCKTSKLETNNISKKERKESEDTKWKRLDIGKLGDKLMDGRKDLRGLEVFSVDPEGCTDIDDAVHVKFSETEFSCVEVGIHIADVTFFLKENSILDKIASERGTSVYLVQKRLDMLPEILSSNVCSLHENVDRLAVSIIMNCFFERVLAGQNGDGSPRYENEIKIVPSYIGRTLIRSRRAFSYDEASVLLERKSSTGEAIRFEKEMKTLSKIAQYLRRKRIEKGAVILSSLKPSFKVSEETLQPTEGELYATGEANEMVEEMMILANVTAAETIKRKYPSTAVLRKHPSMSPEQFEEAKVLVQRYCSKRRIPFKVESQSDLTDFLSSLEKYGVSKEELSKVSSQLSRRMSRATYFCAGDSLNYKHFGLALGIYTHFTSPIRRYADVLVHRMLLGIVSSEESRIAAIVNNVNEKYLRAKRVGMKSVELFAKILLKKMKEEPFHLSIVSVWEGGVVAYVKKLAYEVKLFLGTKENDPWEVDLQEFRMQRRKDWVGIDTETVSKDINSIELFDDFQGVIKIVKASNKKGKVFEKSIVKIIKRTNPVV